MIKCRIKDLAHLWYDKQNLQEINRLVALGYWISEPYPVNHNNNTGLGVCLTLYEPFVYEDSDFNVKNVH